MPFLLLASLAHALPVPVGDDATLDIGGLVQTQAVVQPEAAPDGESLGFDIFVRRARLIVTGTFGKRWTFVFVTDSPNLGKNGDWTPRVLVQDALVSGMVGRGLSLDAGLLLLPFGHHGSQGATSLNTLDYHSSLLLYPTGSTQTWRDAGFAARGLLFGDHLHYRLGVYNGVEGLAGVDADGEPLPVSNPADWPRFAGQIRGNILGAEERIFLGGIHFSDKPLLSVGASGIVQPGAVGVDEDAEPWVALSGDVYADLPVGKAQEFVGQAMVVHYEAGEGALTTGTGGFVELGYRLGPVEPVLSAELFFSDADASDTQNYRVGLDVWLRKHNANVKIEAARSTIGEADPVYTGTLQTQLQL